MVVDYCDPDGDITKQWSHPSAPADHFQEINDGVRQPTVPSSDDIAATDGDENAVDQFTMTSLSNVDEVTQVTVWTYGNCTAGEDARVNLYIGAWQGQAWVGLGTSGGWRSYTKTGSWTQEQLNAMQVQYQADSVYGKFDGTWIRACYCEITYSEVAVGYGHDYMGVPAANIGSVSGVPTANIASIKGV